MEKFILVLGANSAIARAAAAAFAERGDVLYLASRDKTETERTANDLRIRFGKAVHHGYFDADDPSSHTEFFSQVLHAMGKLDGVLLSFGYLGDPNISQLTEYHAIIQRNFTGAVSILNVCADYFTTRRSGFIAGISSVAGDRGKASNYIYGAAKAGFSTYLQGLRNQLFKKNVKVITIKPGFVDTAMTFGKPGMFLLAKPQVIGKKIVAAIEQQKDIVYLPWFWRYIMGVVRWIPEFFFKKLSW